MSLQPTYNKLLELPLFQGMSIGDLEQVVLDTRFGFINTAGGRTVVKEGDNCSRLLFLFKGMLCSESIPDDRRYIMEEEIYAPNILQPECLFGLTQRYTKTFKAVTDCEFMTISKHEAMILSEKFEIFRLNLLNILCTQTQKTARHPWRKHPQGIRAKISRFMEMRCTKPAGRKTLYIKMEQLGREINESRLNISRELNAMNDEGIITLRRGEICFPALERFIQTAEKRL